VDFDACFDLVIGHEKGFQCNPKDRGNYTPDGRLVGTNYGISARSYPHEDIPGMTLQRAKEIYLDDFWRAAGCEQVPELLRFPLFDFAVNSGPDAAAKALQRAAGVVADGVIGPITRAAMAAKHPLALFVLLDAEREELMAGDSAWPAFGKGWIRRLITNKRLIAREF
jgi:lysozyme family protein